jgi:hypothetical protein
MTDMSGRILASVGAGLLVVLAIAPIAHAQQQAVRSYIDGESAYRAGDLALAEQKFRDCLNSPDVPRDRGSKVRLVSQQYGFYPEVYLALIYQQQRRYQDVLTYVALAKRYIKNSDPLYIVFSGAEAEARRMLALRGGSGDDGRQPDVGPVSTSAAGVRQYALVIGIDRYDDPKFPTLKTAVADASDIARVLHDRYGFETKFLEDPDRHDILTALDGYRRVLSDASSLLIYYAGHGNYDSGTDRAYWLPRDAENLSTANWISADDITNDIRGMAARHVIVISDSCYSGGLTRDAPVEVAATEHSRYVENAAQRKSRHLLSSGANEPVADGGANGHSVFAGALLTALDRIETAEFTASELFQNHVSVLVSGRSLQSPQYVPIRNSGHEGGDFVFYRIAASPPAPGR